MPKDGKSKSGKSETTPKGNPPFVQRVTKSAITPKSKEWEKLNQMSEKVKKSNPITKLCAIAFIKLALKVIFLLLYHNFWLFSRYRDK